MGLWNALLDLKSADFLVHFGNHFVDRRPCKDEGVRSLYLTQQIADAVSILCREI